MIKECFNLKLKYDYLNQNLKKMKSSLIKNALIDLYISINPTKKSTNEEVNILNNN